MATRMLLEILRHRVDSLETETNYVLNQLRYEDDRGWSPDTAPMRRLAHDIETLREIASHAQSIYERLVRSGEADAQSQG